MRFIIVGMGVQGLKRQKYLGNKQINYIEYQKYKLYEKSDI